jgi:uncharacterized protein (DUF427 family)
MSLTHGTGPFGQRPAGRFNRDLPREGLVYVEELPRRIRVRFGGETVADSHRPRLVHEYGLLPVYHFPEADVRTDLLRPAGEGRWSVEAGDRLAEDAAWSRPDQELLDGLIAFRWDAMDEWLEEDELLVGHARDPYSRIDVRATSRHVVVRVAGEVVADSTRTLMLFEAGLPPRFYFPPEDVRRDLLEPTDSTSVCAYKGFASYWSLGDEADLVWTYRDPHHDALRVKDMLAFWDERVDVELDGEPRERPVTQWSRRR